ncbi:hypothetical protein BC833DRAFT_588132 [Globomyces pollinis-pini]|nr:hypothetical protein BC833DRAFT_588132 [Globomyces pollinis-pini]
MITSGPGGFAHTPTTKALIMITGINSVLVGLMKTKSTYDLVLYPHLVSNHQFWRLFTSHFVYSSSSDLALASLLLYQFKTLERHWGTYKFTSLLFISSTLSIMLNLIAMSFGITKRISSGPIGFIFTLLYYFVNDIPHSYQMKILGITFPDNVFLYILSFQLLIFSGLESTLPALTGLLSGIIISKFSFLNQWRFPTFIRNLATDYVLPLIASSIPPQRSQSTSPVENVQTTATEVTVPLSDEDIVMLESMGFPRARAIEALTHTRNDIERAIAYLLEQTN